MDLGAEIEPDLVRKLVDVGLRHHDQLGEATVVVPLVQRHRVRPEYGMPNHGVGVAQHLSVRCAVLAPTTTQHRVHADPLIHQSCVGVGSDFDDGASYFVSDDGGEDGQEPHPHQVEDAGGEPGRRDPHEEVSRSGSGVGGLTDHESGPVLGQDLCGDHVVDNPSWAAVRYTSATAGCSGIGAFRDSRKSIG